MLSSLFFDWDYVTIEKRTHSMHEQILYVVGNTGKQVFIILTRFLRRVLSYYLGEGVE